MSIRTWQTSNPLPRLHRLEPIREVLAWWRKISDSGPLRQQKNRPHGPQAGADEHCHRPAGRLVSRFRDRPAIQIPIDCPRS